MLPVSKPYFLPFTRQNAARMQQRPEGETHAGRWCSRTI